LLPRADIVREGEIFARLVAGRVAGRHVKTINGGFVMAVPLYLWLKDESGADIRGSSEVLGREGSIEVLSLSHGLNMPTDGSTGKLMGTRTHRPLTIEKEIDRSSALLYRAVACGLTLQAGELKFYRTNEAGLEVAYFTILMKNVKVVGVSPRVLNIKEVVSQHRNHFEVVEFRYEEITWNYTEGNMIFKDAWNYF
jgi:type VI secretion system secreted protein Hcp